MHGIPRLLYSLMLLFPIGAGRGRPIMCSSWFSLWMNMPAFHSVPGGSLLVSPEGPMLLLLELCQTVPLDEI